jgi:hypothetical protein
MSSAVFYGGGGGLSESEAQDLIDAAVAPLPKHLDIEAPSTNVNWGVMPGAGTLFTNTTTFNLTDSTLYYMPFVPPVDQSFTEMICDVATSGTLLTIGCVELDPADWQPKATGIICQGNPSGTVGIKSLTGLTCELTAGALYATFMIATGTLGLERVRADMTHTKTSWINNTGSGFHALSLLSIAGETVGTQSDPMPDWNAASTGADGQSITMLFRP